MKDSDYYSDREPESRRSDSTSPSLIDRARAGEKAAWQQLVFVYRPLAQRWCCRRHGLRPQDADDVTQEVFTTVFTKLADFQCGEKGSFRKWLFTITWYKALDHRGRNRDKPQAAGGSSACEQLANVPAPPEDDVPESEQEAERVLLLRRAMELIRPEFKPKTWEAVSRVLLGEQTPAEVAAELGMSVTALYTAKSRVLGRLREVLNDLHF